MKRDRFPFTGPRLLLRTLPVSAALWLCFLAGDALAGHGEGESSAGLPQLETSTFPSQLFWLCITFGILYAVFSRKSLPEISGVLENRAQHIQSDLETAENLRSQAEAAQNAYESSLNGARHEAHKIMQELQDSLKAKAEKQNETFRKKAEKDIRELEQRIATEKAEAMSEMNGIAAEIAAEAARKIVGINADPDQARTVVESLNGAKAKAA